MKRSEKLEIIRDMCRLLAQDIERQLTHNPLKELDEMSPLDMLRIGVDMIELKMNDFARSEEGQALLKRCEETETAKGLAAVTPFRRPGQSSSTH
jgi:hypothetical protein